MKFGNTTFRPDLCKGMDFSTFQERYLDRVPSDIMKEVFKALGGEAMKAKKPSKKSKKED